MSKHNKTEAADNSAPITVDNETGEIMEAAAPIGASDVVEASPTSRALSNPRTMNDALAKMGFKVTKQVTRPLLKFGTSPSVVTFKSAFYPGREVPNGTMGIPLMADVLDHASGLECQAILGAVLQSELIRTYGDVASHAVFDDKKSTLEQKAEASKSAGLTGRVFMIAKIPVDGKKYAAFAVAELAPV